MKTYKVGDKVFWSRCGTRQVDVPCTVCFGKLYITLILGDGSAIELPCDYCGKGYNAPRGVISVYEYFETAEIRVIDEVRTNERNGFSSVEYLSDSYYLDKEDIFDSEDDALKRCAFKTEQQRTEQETRTEFIKKDIKKSFSWNAGYHMREAKRLKESISYHEKRAIICKEKYEPSHR